MRELIRELAQSATVIVSTHILQEVQAVCERVLILRAGKLVVDARMDELQPARRLLVSVRPAMPGGTRRCVEGVAGCRRTARRRANGRFTLRAGRRRPRPRRRSPPLCGARRPRSMRCGRERRDLETVFAEVNRPAKPPRRWPMA